MKNAVIIAVVRLSRGHARREAAAQAAAEGIPDAADPRHHREQLMKSERGGGRPRAWSLRLRLSPSVPCVRVFRPGVLVPQAQAAVVRGQPPQVVGHRDAFLP